MDYKGSIDQISGCAVVGWAYADGAVSSQVEVFIDDIPIGKVEANELRLDLLVSGMGTGSYGFRCPIPHDLRVRRDSVVYATVAEKEIPGSRHSVTSLLADTSLLF